MGIDNNGILFLGLEKREVNVENVPGLNMDDFDNDAEGALYFWRKSDESRPRLTIQWQNGEREGKLLIGFELANSGSYGCKEVVGLAEKIALYTTSFLQLFRKHPKMWIMNYQW